MKLLLSESAYERIGAALSALADVEPILADAQRRLRTVSGDGLSLDALRVDAVWATFDAFGGPAGRLLLSRVIDIARPAWVQNGGAGFDDPAFRMAVDAGAVVTTSHGQASGMSEFVVAAIMDHLQCGPERRAAQAQRAWRRIPYREVEGTRWLVIGFGAVGQAIGLRGRALGAHVVGVRRTQGRHESAHEIASLDRVWDYLPGADAVVLCIPLQRETRGLANARFFAAMKPDSVLVNVGRGALIEDDALIAALGDRRPGRAALDVFDVEPLPNAHPFWDHPCITVTAHNSPVNNRRQARNDALFLENLRRYLAGDVLLNVAAPADVLAHDNDAGS